MSDGVSMFRLSLVMSHILLSCFCRFSFSAFYSDVDLISEINELIDSLIINDQAAPVKSPYLSPADVLPPVVYYLVLGGSVVQ